MPTAKRTLVKSGPELWAEVSDPEALGALFARFGEIRITRTADASLVEWEGERATGRLELEPSGFGTRVALTADIAAGAPPPAAAPQAPPEPEPAPRPGFWARLFRRAPEPVAPAEPPPPPAPVPGPPVMPEADALAVLTATLDALGSARHRPFSR